MNTAEPLELKLPSDVTLRGLRWNRGASVQVLALHGWLDNAHSFLPMAPFLPDSIDLVAIDQAGHGWSEHRPDGGWYSMMDFARDAELVADALGWQAFSLLGHSLGGAISCLIAAGLPQRVRCLTIVEGLGPLPGEPQQAATRMREALAGLKQASLTQLRRHVTPEAAAQARLKTNRMLPDSAAQLVERGLRQTSEGWVWRTDPRLRIASPMRFTESEILYLLAGIRCPVFQIMPDPPSKFMSMPHMQRRKAMLDDYQQLDVAGHHHVHMDAPETCASALFDFLLHHQDLPA